MCRRRSPTSTTVCPVRIEFEYEGYAVTVRSDGRIHIE
ncbi:HalOD1 output domain-containing protein [Halosolutus halophilus]